MRNRRMAVILMLLALAFACLVSSTALSGEHPWDSDKGGGPGGTGGSGGDPTIGDPTLITPTRVVAQAPRFNGNCDLRTELLVHVAKYAANYLYGDDGKFGSRTRPSTRVKASH